MTFSRRAWRSRRSAACAGLNLQTETSGDSAALDDAAGGTSPSSPQLTHRDGRIGHAVGESPFVIVPGQDPHEAALDDLRLAQIEGRAGWIMVEVARDERMLVDRKNAIQRPVARSRRLHNRFVDGLDRGGLFRGTLEIDQRDI